MKHLITTIVLLLLFTFPSFVLQGFYVLFFMLSAISASLLWAVVKKADELSIIYQRDFFFNIRKDLLIKKAILAAIFIFHAIGSFFVYSSGSESIYCSLGKGLMHFAFFSAILVVFYMIMKLTERIERGDYINFLWIMVLLTISCSTIFSLTKEAVFDYFLLNGERLLVNGLFIFLPGLVFGLGSIIVINREYQKRTKTEQ